MLPPLTKQEKALLQILRSDIYAPQFFWKQSNRVDPYRVYDYQYFFDDDEDNPQMVYSDARAVGKSEKIKRNCFTFPFKKPGRERMISAPQEVHLNPLLDQTIDNLEEIRLMKELLKSVKRKPYYLIKFKNGTRIIGKIPGVRGTNVKATHVDYIDVDESQDYPEEGWVNLRECLNEVPDKKLRSWGVPNGVRNTFFNFTQSGEFKHVVIPAMYKLTWGERERREKIAFYGSKRAPGYVRNIYAEHGDAEYLVFIPSKLSLCIDYGRKNKDGTYDKESPTCTKDYIKINILNENVNRNMLFEHYLRFPESHKNYRRVWVGMDIGHEVDPTEILVWAEELHRGKNRVRLVSRIHCERLTDDDQADIIEIICKFYNVVGVAFDATARGGTVWQKVLNKDLGTVFLSGYKFNSMKEVSQTKDGKPITIRIRQLAIEILQNMCSHREFMLPYDEDIMADWMGLKMKPLSYGKFDIIKDVKYKTHTLFAAGMMALQREDYRLGRLAEEDENYEEGGWLDAFDKTPGAST